MTRYIDADALMEDLRIAKPITETEAVAFRFAYLKVKDAPTADVVTVVPGKWLHDSTGANYCSECGMYPYDDGKYHMVWHADYCPNCGARMEEEGTRYPEWRTGELNFFQNCGAKMDGENE